MTSPSDDEKSHVRSTVPFRIAVLLARYTVTRSATDRLCESLEPDDYQIQAHSAAMPLKWHLAHTTWFFEHFLLVAHRAGYRVYNPSYAKLFDTASGESESDSNPAKLSRPTVRDVIQYRRHVDDAMGLWMTEWGDHPPAGIVPILEQGLQHEQRHQEMMLVDLKAAFAKNPLLPIYSTATTPQWPTGPARPFEWQEYPGGLCELGHNGANFCFDHELPRHKVFLKPFALASRLVTAGEFERFVEDGGYRRRELWDPVGWARRKERSWLHPRYWVPDGERWKIFTLAGLRSLTESEPVCHVNYYEAEAYARWMGLRLPTEAEWEVAATGLHPNDGVYADTSPIHPRPAEVPTVAPRISQIYGDCWEWTATPYTTYPGFRPPVGVLSQFETRFSAGSMVLRGGSCATPRGHMRATYRLALMPDVRWQFTGLRLARDA